jgi:hypothetical protein
MRQGRSERVIRPVIPAEAGIQWAQAVHGFWTPEFAGVTVAAGLWTPAFAGVTDAAWVTTR